MHFRALILTLISSLLFTVTGHSSMTREQAVEQGRSDVDSFLSGDVKKLWGTMSPDFQEHVGGLTKFEQIAHQTAAQFGSLTQTLHEDALPAPGGSIVYTRVVKLSQYPSPLVFTVAFRPAPAPSDGFLTTTFLVRLEPNPYASSFAQQKLKTAVQFPLVGQWVVYQGGSLVSENYHAATADERFAYDLVAIKNDALFSGPEEDNKSWFSFDQPVLADADGVVSFVESGVSDNTPGHPNSGVPKYGNSVVIDHLNGEFSMYAHLKEGSILLKPGMAVKAGQVIARTGNSGDSPFSHLHYHIQNSGQWFGGFGLQITFHSLMVNGKTMQDVTPVKGDAVSQVE